ncbi:PAS domain S-box protein [uncultured Methanobacterium sp.]|uniref:PAS domain S-box protein n=1 Tax=uncultured Methanobacterium sp. TaxID=176306 RepID=UPI002AA80A8E|nr:PAS domain S-box protein [uncultured Methanobacterium sp.]
MSIYKSIFQTSLDAMLLTKPDGSILAANHTAEKMFGMSQDEIIAVGRDGLLIQDESFHAAIKERAQKGRIKAELIFKRKNGSLFKGEVTSTFFTDEDKILKTHSVIRDISDRQKAEESLQESERKWRILFETLPVGVSVLDKERNVVYYNPSLGKILGLSKDDLISKKFVNRKYVYSDMNELSFDEIPSNKAFNEKKLVHEEIGVIKEDNSIIWTMVSATPLPFSDLSVIIVTSDITARKNVEEDLKRHAALLDVSYEAIFSWNFENGILSWNQGAETLYGYNKKESIGSNSHNLLKTQFPIDLNEFLEKLKKDKIWSGELVHARKDGKRIIVESRLQLIEENSGEIVVIETNRDITDRKKSEIKLNETLDNLEEIVEERTKELELANDYNRNLIETSLDPLVTIGPDGKITDVNKATEKVTGYLRGELVGNDFADYFTEPDKAKKGYKEVFQYGLVRDYPLEIRHKNGTLTPVLYNASIYRDGSGEVVGVFAAARDITELKKAEKELREYWENLEEEVKLRTEELAKSNADLEQFAYVASHDLREPLRMITSFLQLLDRRYNGQLDSDGREFINFAVDGAKRLDKMIIDLLEYSRIANKEMMFSEVDFEKVIDQVKLNLNIIIYENNAEVTYDYLPKRVMADENQMIVLFQNLVGNAIKYRSNEKPKIHISAQKEKKFFTFKVKDNGIGMDSKYLERIFTIFQRLHTHNEYEGSGIGLSIAQRIVHQHGGEIWVESEPGKGSTFIFTIKI